MKGAVVRKDAVAEDGATKEGVTEGVLSLVSSASRSTLAKTRPYKTQQIIVLRVDGCISGAA